MKTFIKFLILGFISMLAAALATAIVYHKITLDNLLPLFLVTYAVTVFTSYISGGFAETIEEDIPMYTNTTKYYYHGYMNGMCRVEKIVFDENGNHTVSFNFINTDGEYISEKWYPGVSDFCEAGTALITDGSRYNFINKEGKVVNLMWFASIDPFNGDVAKVHWDDGKINFVNTEGKLLFKDWVEEIKLQQQEN